MKYFWNLFVILLVFFAQNSVVPYFRIFNIQPDVLLIVIISFAFLEGPNYGSVNGFFGGLLQDLLGVRDFGIGMISKTLIGYGSGLLEKTIFSENRVMVAPAIAIATIASKALYNLIAFLLGSQIHINYIGFVFPQALYNAVLGIPLYLILEKFWDLPNVGQSKEVTLG